MNRENLYSMKDHISLYPNYTQIWGQNKMDRKGGEKNEKE